MSKRERNASAHSRAKLDVMLGADDEGGHKRAVRDVVLYNVSAPDGTRDHLSLGEGLHRRSPGSVLGEL